ncbi:hypothetical protein ACFL5O_02180 [Myxococcota bacterium]
MTSTCEPPSLPANQMLVLGDALIEFTPFTDYLEQHALDAGILAPAERIRDHSAALMSLLAEGSLSIGSQYAEARQAGPARVVVMDGGETDMLGGLCDSKPSRDCPSVRNAVRGAQLLLQQMAENGVQHVFYFFYPDPRGNPQTKAGLDVLRPLVENVCGHSPLACHWVDLRPVFADHPDYLGADGLVFSEAGARVSAAAIWERMRERCVVP